MATQHYKIHLWCSECQARDTATGSDNDNGPNFQVDHVPRGFKHTSYSPNPWNQQFRHECGGAAEYELT